MILGKSNKEIYDELSRYVYGHDAAKKALINALNRSNTRYYQKWGRLENDANLINNSTVLLIGASGTGKTHLVETLSRVCKFPLLKYDATRLNPVGAKGGQDVEQIEQDITTKAKEYYNTHKNDKTSPDFSYHGVADRMVIFIDEFDKLAKPFESSGNWHKQTQASLLKLIENKGQYTGLTFILAGAFTDLHKVVKVKSRPIGFCHGEKEKEEDTNIISEEQLISYGILPEIVGRLSAIRQLDKLTKKDYAKILDNHVLPKIIREMAILGYHKFNISRRQRKALIEKATSSELGVRSLFKEMLKISEDTEFNIEEKACYLPLLK